MKVTSTGLWEGTDTDNEHCHDERLEDWISTYFQINKVSTILEFGCGLGKYAKRLLDDGINVRAYDGNPYTPELTNGIAKVLDVSKPIKLEPAEWVLALEIGEHIPKEFEENFIMNIHNHNTKGVFLSWAIPGQDGLGHVNCQPNDYIINIFNNLGYKLDIKSQQNARNFSTLPWFKNTIMIFLK